MVLTRSQYENMSKEEFIQELLDMNSSFGICINTKLYILSERHGEFTSKHDSVYSELQQCKSLISDPLTNTVQLEHNAVANSQKSRREITELNPIPAKICGDVLEKNVCKVLSLTGVNVVPVDFCACNCVQGRTDL